jgi:hypothetical protein
MALVLVALLSLTGPTGCVFLGRRWVTWRSHGKPPFRSRRLAAIGKPDSTDRRLFQRRVEMILRSRLPDRRSRIRALKAVPPGSMVCNNFRGKHDERHPGAAGVPMQPIDIHSGQDAIEWLIVADLEGSICGGRIRVQGRCPCLLTFSPSGWCVGEVFLHTGALPLPIDFQPFGLVCWRGGSSYRGVAPAYLLSALRAGEVAPCPSARRAGRQRVRQPRGLESRSVSVSPEVWASACPSARRAERQ